MRPTKNLEELIKRLHFKADADLHERAISDALQAQAKSKEIKSASVGPINWRIMLKSPIIKIALASLIILAVSFFVYNSRPVEKVDTVNVTKVTKSPAELLTVASLNMAYRHGGIKAIEKQCEEAVDKLGPQPAKITAKELLAEFNGT
jgi:hypothetical protein